jgi:PTH2 family peptidyl-tRNA hydrolase
MPPRSKYKQIIVVPDSLAMSPGKMAAQASHAAVEAFRVAQKSEAGLSRIAGWTLHGITKIILRVKDEEELVTLAQRCAEAGLTDQFVVVDEGLTEVPAGSRTAFGIGPYESELLAPFTGHLAKR